MIKPLITAAALCIAVFSYAQETPLLKVTNTMNEQAVVYNSDSIMHTAWRPHVYVAQPLEKNLSDSWLKRKFFNEHLLQVQQPGFNLNGDLIFDEYIGSSKRFVETPAMNTRGYEVSGNVSNKFYFETAFYENQGRFGGYLDSFIRMDKVVPGQNIFKNVGDGKGFDFSISEARLVYMPAKIFTAELGYGKNFIGDGYRSMLLSDLSYNYPYLKASLNVGKLQYNVMWSQFVSDRNRSFNNKEGEFRKWAQTFFIDWKATSKLSVGLFESVMWPDQQDTAAHRVKDMSAWIASPIIFVHGNQSPSGVPNNVLTGINAKYKILDKTDLYAQYVADNLFRNDALKNRYAIQAGVRTGDFFGVKNWNVIAEYNMASPYMYATNTYNTNYAHAKQALAHPLGANFSEALFMTDYLYKRWYIRFETFVAKYGADSSDNVNYGSDIFKHVDDRTVTSNVQQGQGLNTSLLFGDVKLAYILNPLTNMRIEAGCTLRREKNAQATYNDRIVYIGIRMSFRKISYDF